VFFLAVVALLSGCVSQPGSFVEHFDEAAWRQAVKSTDLAMLYAPHVDPGGKFFNPWMRKSEQARRPDGPVSWFFRKRKGFPEFPRERYVYRENDYAYLKDREAESISFVGHASLIVKMDGETVFTDPFFSKGALVMGKDVKIPFDFSKVPERPVVLISHNHYDHLDKYSVKGLIKRNAVFVVPVGLKGFLTKLGAKEVYELDWWQDVRIGPLSYTLLPAQHWSRRVGQGNRKTLWGSYLIQGSRTVYFSGDSGYFRGFEEYGRRYSIDYAILGAGAYEPRWFMHYHHMNVAEFFAAAEDLQAKIAIPMHFGVISLSDEPLVYPLYEVDEFLKKNPAYRDKIRPLRVGEYLELSF
jgi:L-ascorbate metabolism protein UlaG (beta-lactamase superfamily)